jgi:hypothetical protein
MQFQLPSNLQTELLAYDPTLKVLAKQAKATTTKKSKYPLGNIPHLIPHNVVRESDQQAAIDHINQQKAPDRYRVFTTPVDVATPQARLKVIAILYHYEQVWYAAWLPPKQDKSQYVYGHGYAFKNTAAAAKVAPSWIWNSKDKCIEHTIGRGVQTFTFSETITEEDIKASFDSGYKIQQWQASNLYCQKGYQIRDHAVIPFEKSLKEDIPTWDDCRGIFDRLRCKNIFDAAEIPGGMSKYLDNNDGLTVDNLINAANKFNEQNVNTSSTYCTLASVEHIISKPAIKRLLQQELDRSINAYTDSSNTKRAPIKQGFSTFVQVINSIDWIRSLWPDCPIDYYQTYYKELRYIKLNHIRTRSYDNNSTALVDWLRQHMPVASMFTMMRKYLEQQDLKLWTDSDVGYSRQSFFELNDTFSMALRILKHGKELVPPKRWRIGEFHDHVQAESWKIQNPNESLRQDLFPEPIRVDRGDKHWSFFQPVDTHQLAMWGQAVRNCVGSASHYADDIKKRKHFIVLCMIDGKPAFTIQLVVDMGLMSVKQIAGVANQRLTEEQREAYTEAFREALHIRESALTSDC